MTDTPTSPNTPDPQAPTPAPPGRRRRQRLAAPIVVTVVAAVIALLAGLGPKVTGGSTPTPEKQPVAGSTQTSPGAPAPESDAGDAQAAEQIAALAQLARRTPGDPLALGREDAPVVLINYSEFQCPYCGKFARDTKPTLVRDYVDQGLLRIEWRDFPYLGEESVTAALAARAAAAQGKFWQFHDAMFADQQPPNSGALTDGFLTTVARGVGLDTKRFRADLADPGLQAEVEQDFLEGQSIGVNGTPAFLINGNPVMGAQPTETFTRIIDAEIARAQGT